MEFVFRLRRIIYINTPQSNTILWSVELIYWRNLLRKQERTKLSNIRLVDIRLVQKVRLLCYEKVTRDQMGEKRTHILYLTKPKAVEALQWPFKTGVATNGISTIILRCRPTDCVSQHNNHITLCCPWRLFYSTNCIVSLNCLVSLIKIRVKVLFLHQLNVLAQSRAAKKSECVWSLFYDYWRDTCLYLYKYILKLNHYFVTSMKLAISASIRALLCGSCSKPSRHRLRSLNWIMYAYTKRSTVARLQQNARGKSASVETKPKLCHRRCVSRIQPSCAMVARRVGMFCFCPPADYVSRPSDRLQLHWSV